MNKNPHSGETFESFLRDEGVHDEVTTAALKQIPDFASDEEAERFVETADLSKYDLSDFRSGRIGITTHEEIKARMLAAARGDIQPASDEPKIWIVADPKNRK